MRVQTSELTFCAPVGRGSTAATAEGTVMLSGNDRDVRILCTTASVEVLGTQELTGQVVAELNVTFHTVYADAEGALQSLTAETGAEASIPVEGLTARQSAQVWAGVESVTAQESGGRLSLRANLYAEACAFSQEGVQAVEQVAELDAPERMEQTIRQVCKAGEGRQRTLVAESFQAPAQADARVLFATAQAIVTQAQAGESSVTASGEVLVKTAFTAPQEKYFVQEQRIPFQASIETPGARYGMEGLARAQVQQLLTELRPGESGAPTLFIEYILQLSSEAWQVQEQTVLTDIYSAAEEGATLQTVTREQSYLCGIAPYESRASFTATFPYPESDPAVNTLLAVQPQGAEMSLTTDEGEVSVEGLLNVCLLFEDAQGNVLGESAEAPFTLEFAPAQRLCALQLTVEDAAITQRGDAAEVAFTLVLRGEALEVCEVELIADVTAGESTQAAPTGLTLYYPDPNEDFWQIAKRYRIKLDELSALNKPGDSPVLLYRPAAADE